MKLHRMISYGLMMAGAVASAKAIARRQAWERANIHVGIMLDWDDVQAVATRAPAPPVAHNGVKSSVEILLHQFRGLGATHLSIPEISLKRLLDKGTLKLEQASSGDRVFAQAQNEALAEFVATELQARLPQLKVECSRAKNLLISFEGDLPTVAEVGLGFDPSHAELAHRVGLLPVARPIGYSWIQLEMIERTFEQAARLGAKTVAIQGNLIPGHEFNLAHTVAVMKRHHLRYAYFRESRHQKGDWFLAKSLAPEGLVILAHEFAPEEMLPEDPASISYRWANLAVEAGVRLCSIRFFRVLHAADPLESLTYVEQLAQALRQAGLIIGQVDEVDLTPFQPQRNELTLAMAGLSTAGAIGLASDLLPASDGLKLLGIGGSAVALAGLPFLEKLRARQAQGHHHNHHHHHPDDPDHRHEHDHDHSHHPSATAYAPKGLALAATVAYPAAAAALDSADPLTALTHSLAISSAGATALSAITVEDANLLDIEEYRSYNLDWLLPMGLAAARVAATKTNVRWRWLPVAGMAIAALKNLAGRPGQDLTGSFDREHQREHTHHLSALQRALGDSQMAFSPRPLRKWSLLAPLGAVVATLLKQKANAATAKQRYIKPILRPKHTYDRDVLDGLLQAVHESHEHSEPHLNRDDRFASRSGAYGDELAAVAASVAVAGQVAVLTGFRNGQRPLEKTLQGRAKGWAIGAILAGIVWSVSLLFGAMRRRS